MRLGVLALSACALSLSVSAAEARARFRLSWPSRPALRPDVRPGLVIIPAIGASARPLGAEPAAGSSRPEPPPPIVEPRQPAPLPRAVPIACDQSSLFGAGVGFCALN